MHGYAGRILRVNLSTGDVSIQRPQEDYYAHYLGGRGFIAHTLLTELPKGIDPLGPENKLIFSLGPITGHPLPGSGRNSVGAKSPLTGGFGESEAGGFWGAELKRAGYDAIIFEGVSPKPVYLWIENDAVEIKDAGKLWGLEIADTESAIRDELKNNTVRVAAIGPGGERLIRYATIANDISHIYGRGGLGAVMGSKNLKAVAVKGNRRPAMADKESVVGLARWMASNYKDISRFWCCGTGEKMEDYEKVGNTPVKNFSAENFPQVVEITAQQLFKKGYVDSMYGCFACPIRCKKALVSEEPWTKYSVYGAPEYETLGAFGSNCGVDDLEAIVKAHVLCNRYGIDTISTGMSISFAMECFEKGILTKEDTGGLDLKFGNHEAMLEMVELIALRKGLGAVLAEGTKRAAAKIGKGAEEFAMQVKGLEFPMHNPRFKQGMGLHYSVNAAGADHCCGVHDNMIDSLIPGWSAIDVAESMPPTELSGRKARFTYQVGLWRHIHNYVGLCLMASFSNRQIRDAVEAVTGWPMSYYRLMKVVERGLTLSRIFNLREGFSADDDVLPKRFAQPPDDGPLKGVVVDPKEHAEVKKLYYQMLGWDEAGVPTKGRLAELDMEWAAAYLN